jgi:hypothetical protein
MPCTFVWYHPNQLVHQNRPAAAALVNITASHLTAPQALGKTLQCYGTHTFQWQTHNQWHTYTKLLLSSPLQALLINVSKALTRGCIIHICMQDSHARPCKLEAHQIIPPCMPSAQLSASAIMPAGTLLESMRQHQHTAVHLVSRRQTRQASTPSCKKPSISCIHAVKPQEGPSLSCC